MAIFDIKAGERVSITTGTVNLEMLDLRAKGALRHDVTYEATATDRYQMFEGERRRLFVDVSVDFGTGLREIWLTDGPTVAGEWPEVLNG
jgi:hypothetical protein